MLDQKHRLKKEADIKRVFKDGQAAKEGFVLLKKIANGLEHSRFGFVVSLRVSKKSVVRNKIRRRASEIIRLRLPKIKKGFDVILTVFPGADKLNFPELEGALNKLFQKAKLYG